jgi:hypothetical protein
LLEIRDRRLYRAQGYGTFEDYCRERWGWSYRHVNRQIEAAKVVENLGPIGPTLRSESQARELVRLTPEVLGPNLALASDYLLSQRSFVPLLGRLASFFIFISILKPPFSS